MMEGNASQQDKTPSYEATDELLTFATVIIVPFILVALIGNVITILAFIRDKQLHISINIFILNLAVADLLIGLICMPVYLFYTLNRNIWVLGGAFCKVFLLLDQLCTSVGVVLMILISWDRLMLLHHWSRNYKEETKKRAYIYGGLAWLIMIVAFAPATLFWKLWTEEDTVSSNDCDFEYARNTIYTSFLAILGFPVPFIILLVLNTLIVLKIRKLLKTSAELSNISSLSSSQQSTPSVSMVDLHKGTVINRRNNFHLKEIMHVRTCRKAAKSLAVLLTAFVLTWAPYQFVTLVKAICENCISVQIYETCTWILWFKSAVNPFIYAFNCNRFRTNFRYFMCCGRK